MSTEEVRTRNVHHLMVFREVLPRCDETHALCDKVAVHGVTGATSLSGFEPTASSGQLISELLALRVEHQLFLALGIAIHFVRPRISHRVGPPPSPEGFGDVPAKIEPARVRQLLRTPLHDAPEEPAVDRVKGLRVHSTRLVHAGNNEVEQVFLDPVEEVCQLIAGNLILFRKKGLDHLILVVVEDLVTILFRQAFTEPLDIVPVRLVDGPRLVREELHGLRLLVRDLEVNATSNVWLHVGRGSVGETTLRCDPLVPVEPFQVVVQSFEHDLLHLIHRRHHLDLGLPSVPLERFGFERQFRAERHPK